jgi:hypothetical protein
VTEATIVDYSDDHTLYAHWSKDEDQWVTVTFVNDDLFKGTLTGLQTFNGVKGESIPAITEPGKNPEYGYEFDKWDKTIPTLYPNTDMTITGSWKANFDEWSTVTFVNSDINMGTLTGPLTFIGIKGGSAPFITEPGISPAPGYLFDGWDLVIPATYPAVDTTITAKWIKDEDKWVTVTFVSSDITKGTVTGVSLQFEGVIGQPATDIIEPAKSPAPGYLFNGWDMSIPATYPTADTVIKANWTKDEDKWSTITFVTGNLAQGSLTGALSFSGIIGTPTTTITEPIKSPASGYTFDGWDIAIPTEFQATDLTITAKWKSNAPSSAVILSGIRPIAKLSAGTYQIVLDTGIPATVTYLSSNSNVATVDANGLVKIIKVGSTVIMITVKYPDNSTWTGLINLSIEN